MIFPYTGRDMMAEYRISAYHGTSLSAAKAIREEQHFNESSNDTEWLGCGVYFFAYKESAELWIKRQRKRLFPGTVITVQLEYDGKDMLDLDDPAQLANLNSELKKVQDRMEKILSAPITDRYKRWCLGCNWYTKLHPEVGIISYTFHRPVDGVSGFQPNEKQLCVKHHEIITCII